MTIDELIAQYKRAATAAEATYYDRLARANRQLNENNMQEYTDLLTLAVAAKTQQTTYNMVIVDLLLLAVKGE